MSLHERCGEFQAQPAVVRIHLGYRNGDQLLQICYHRREQFARKITKVATLRAILSGKRARETLCLVTNWNRRLTETFSCKVKVDKVDLRLIIKKSS